MWSPSNVFNSWIWSRGIISIYTSCFVGLYASSYWPISSFSFFRWLVILFLWIAVYFDPFQLYLSTCVSWYLLCFVCLFVYYLVLVFYVTHFRHFFLSLILFLHHLFLVFCAVLCCVFYFIVFVLYLVYPMLSVSLDCSFLIDPSVFSNVYLSGWVSFIDRNITRIRQMSNLNGWAEFEHL